MELAQHIFHITWSMLLFLGIVVFIHEFGHYAVAKMCGVKIETFSLGFGKELIGFTDRSGTRWKLAALPIGGYVKMFGDSSAASTGDTDLLSSLTPEQRKLTFHFKPLYKKAAIVVAGPLANFILTICIYSFFILTTGLSSTEPVVGEIMPNTPAQAAGLQPGDRILKINNDTVENFTDIIYLLSTNLGTPVNMVLERNHKDYTVTLTPKSVEEDDGFGNKTMRPIIGIVNATTKLEDVGPVTAVSVAVKRTYMQCAISMRAIGQIVTGQRSAREMRGTIGIAQLTSQATDKGLDSFLVFIAFISANLGLINLFPIPLLDGGHLVYYFVEAIRGRPVAQRAQEVGFRVGFVIIFGVMAFTLVNDIRRLL